MLDQEQFFDEFKVKDYFEKSGLSWKNLEDIYDDYLRRQSEVDRCVQQLQEYVVKALNVSIHSIRCRKKDPTHLIEKIIRKTGKEQNYKYKDISVSNYCEIIRDLVGMRILVIAKEEWEKVFDEMVRLFPDDCSGSIFMAEEPVAYIRYGDRDIFRDKIHKEHTNKGYRSQHYIVKFNAYYCEIQVRTLTEEVYGEVDHKVKYPYRENNRFLKRYTNTLSQLLGSVDELISTCFQMNEKGWDENNRYFEEDNYIDWKRTSQKSTYEEKTSESQKTEDESCRVPLDSYVGSYLLRKG